MMILHFIDRAVTVTDNCVFDYLPELLNELSCDIKTCVLAPKKASWTKGLEVEKVCLYSDSQFYLLKNVRLFSNILNEIRPDIVHVHGCRSNLSAIMMYCSVKRNIPVVVSTGKIFEPWHFRVGYLTHGLPCLVAFRRRMLKRACAIHALSDQERSNVLCLSWHPSLKSKKPWNDRVSVIYNHNVNPEMTVKDMATEISLLYSKVADSNPFMLMSDVHRTCEDVLLVTGVAPEGACLKLDDETNAMFSTLDETAMRRIMLHAADEGIYKYIAEGALRLKVRQPALTVSAVDRFKSYYSCYKTDTQLESEAFEAIDTDDSITTAERDVCKAIVTVWEKYKLNSLRRVDFALLYYKLRFTDYDEVRLCHALRRFGMLKRSARILTILSERYALGEGFVFTPPLDDRETGRMRRKLHRLGIQ